MSFMLFDPPFIAHRGASNIAPENTLSAFMRAKELGAKWVEFDVMLAACGEVVVIHDDTLERTTNGTGNVADHPYSYLKTLDAGSWFSLEYANERIPTFKEVIAFLRQHELCANVEIKDVPGQHEALVAKVLSDIRENWKADMTPPLISSFSLPVLRLVRKAAPEANLGVLVHEWFDGWEKACQELGSVSVHVFEDILTPPAVNIIKYMDKMVLSYTVNSPHRAEDLFAMGVDAVYTDEFELLKDEVVLG